jgi:hypothetical protein
MDGWGWGEGTVGCGMVGKDGWLGEIGGGNGWLWNCRKGWMVGENGRKEWVVVE